ncbi:hypothetical protein L3Y34_013129 [Caenorhabditis briggsae]|uniref:Secreted protein n=1 Tax=Caenorhabditis briggsae TaxID=6238 RepID=A0AAE8ZW47_CAEBR|nr:hypothetical protein L3Y34_013129 [Caenorhabditis briggsae]
MTCCANLFIFLLFLSEKALGSTRTMTINDSEDSSDCSNNESLCLPHFSTFGGFQQLKTNVGTTGNHFVSAEVTARFLQRSLTFAGASQSSNKKSVVEEVITEQPRRKVEEIPKPFEPGPRTEIRWHNAICCAVIEAMATTLEVCMACFRCQGGHC